MPAGAPFGFGALLILVAFIVACTINKERAEKGLQQPPGDPLAEALLLHHGDPQGATRPQNTRPKPARRQSSPSGPLTEALLLHHANSLIATSPQEIHPKPVRSHSSDSLGLAEAPLLPRASAPGACTHRDSHSDKPSLAALSALSESDVSLCSRFAAPLTFESNEATKLWVHQAHAIEGWTGPLLLIDLRMIFFHAVVDEEAPQEVGRRPSIHYPKNYVLQHSDGPAILLDMTPEIAAEIMAPEVVNPISLPASRTASRTLSCTLPPQESDDMPSSSNSQEEEAAALLPQSTSAGPNNP